MSLFGKKEKGVISHLEKVVERKDERIKQLEDLCAEKDEYYLSAISDGMRHGSSDAARQMAYRKQYLKDHKK